MKKYKNLSKPELMEKQNTLSVHSGGRFVSLDLETEVQHAGSCKKKAEQILATVVMGMNLVNTVAPLAVLVAAEQKLGAAPQPARSEAEPLDYAVLPQLADMVDRAMFARAEAATDYDGNASVASMGDGDTQTITAGQSGTVDVMSGYSNSCVQIISAGGTGTVSTLADSGEQFIFSGSGTVKCMSGGSQFISGEGLGTVDTIDSGYQYIGNGMGIVSTLNGGGQNVNGGTGITTVMFDGEQTVDNEGVAILITMNGGSQSIGGRDGYGMGIVSTMSGGLQRISYFGSGIVVNMSGGGQNIASRCSGTVSNMNGGGQNIASGGSGTVSTMNGGEQEIRDGGAGTVSALNGGRQIISSGGTSLDTVLNSSGTVYQNSGGIISNITYSGGVQVIDNITAGYDNMTLGSGGTNVTMGIISGAQMRGTIINSGGEQLILNGGTALDTELNGGIMQMSSGGIVSGMTMTGGSMVLENIDGGSFNINGTLTANNAVIDMNDSSVTRAGTPAYESLTIDTLSGSGTTFILDTDLAGEANSDKVTITHADVGTHYVQIKDLSKLNNIEVTGEHKQLLITDASGKLTFVGKEFNAGGLWDVEPTLSKGDALGLSANDWYLTNMVKTVNNDTSVLLDAADNSYAMWRNTNDSLRSRLGALASGREQADGVWARTQAGRFSGSGYEGRYNLYQLGFEKQFKGGSIYGGAIDYGDGSGSYAPGSSKDNLRSFSLYGIWTAGSGAYTNVTARVGNFSTDLESYGDYPDKASYKQHAYSLSVEYGKRFDFEAGFFVEPQAQFTLGRLAGIDYTTDRSVNGRIDGMNSAIGRIGFVMGQKIENGSDIYLKADLLHEFAGERDLQLTSAAGGTNDILTKHNDYGDTWFELGLGGNVRISKTGNFYGEVTRGFGGDINKKWSVNAGLRFTF